VPEEHQITNQIVRITWILLETGCKEVLKRKQTSLSQIDSKAQAVPWSCEQKSNRKKETQVNEKDLYKYIETDYIK